MDVINQNAGYEYRAYFTDRNDAPTIPETVHWRVRCETTGEIPQDWTQVVPVPVSDESGLVECYAVIEVPSTVNALQSSRNAQELKTLLIVANKDLPGEYSEDPPHQYYVRRVKARG